MIDGQHLEDRIAILERQQALQTETLRRIVEGHWTGAEGAAGLIVALVGGQEPADFEPVPFESP